MPLIRRTSPCSSGLHPKPPNAWKRFVRLSIVYHYIFVSWLRGSSGRGLRSAPSPAGKAFPRTRSPRGSGKPVRPLPVREQCGRKTQWGKCVQPNNGHPLCKFHHQWSQRKDSPDDYYHKKVVLGLAQPAQALFSPEEIGTLLHGKSRGDGRRLDQWVLDGPMYDVDSATGEVQQRRV